MYNKIRAFVKPRGKVLYKFWNPFNRIEVAFTKTDIMIYDYINCHYLPIYNVNYDIENIDICLFLDIMQEIVDRAPVHLFDVKYFQYITDKYMSVYNQFHC